MKYKNRLEELRKQQNLSQTQIADELNITQQAYSNYENGKREADYGTLANLAIYFNTTIDYILGISNDPTPPNKKDPLEQPTIEEIIANDTELSEESKQDLLKQLDMLKMRDNLKKYNKDGSSELQSKPN